MERAMGRACEARIPLIPGLDGGYRSEPVSFSVKQG